jgi:hypothetical protein
MGALDDMFFTQGGWVKTDTGVVGKDEFLLSKGAKIGGIIMRGLQVSGNHATITVSRLTYDNIRLKRVPTYLTLVGIIQDSTYEERCTLDEYLEKVSIITILTNQEYSNQDIPCQHLRFTVHALHRHCSTSISMWLDSCITTRDKQTPPSGAVRPESSEQEIIDTTTRSI